MKLTAEEITRITGAKTMQAEPLSKHTSFKIGGPADFFIEPENMRQLADILRLLNEEKVPFFVMGNGTNLLVSDEGYRGAIIRLSGDFTRFWYEGCLLVSGAAVPLAQLARDAGSQGFANLVFAAGIPGTVGGALYMNAGAHGQCIADVLKEAVVLDSSGKVHTFKPADLGLTYRQSKLPAGSIVCQAVFKLVRGDAEEIRKKCLEYREYRQKRQPKQPSAGSIFKNPPGLAAGKLVEEAGLKGKKIGGAMISETHANFVVNCGNATAADVMALIELARAEVLKQFGVELELEIKLLGN